MATVKQVLHHLVSHAPGLSDVQRLEFHEAVEETPGLEYDPALDEPGDIQDETPKSIDDRISALKAELTALEASQG